MCVLYYIIYLDPCGDALCVHSHVVLNINITYSQTDFTGFTILFCVNFAYEALLEFQFYLL